MLRLRALLVPLLALAAPAAIAEEEQMSDVDAHDVPVHNALETKYFLSVVDLFAQRNFNVRARGSVTPQVPRQYVDFESDLDVGDSPELFVVEFRWQLVG